MTVRQLGQNMGLPEYLDWLTYYGGPEEDDAGVTDLDDGAAVMAEFGKIM
jgi:hypothetical protein